MLDHATRVRPAARFGRAFEVLLAAAGVADDPADAPAWADQPARSGKPDRADHERWYGYRLSHKYAATAAASALLRMQLEVRDSSASVAADADRGSTAEDPVVQLGRLLVDSLLVGRLLLLRLHVSPDGPLSLIPWGAFGWGDRELRDTLTVVRAPSPRSFVQQRLREARFAAAARRPQRRAARPRTRPSPGPPLVLADPDPGHGRSKRSMRSPIEGAWSSRRR